MPESKKQGLATRNRRVQTNGSISGTTKNFTVRMRELIADVQSSTSFQPQQVEINPGLSTTFSWLHQIAGAYEKYIIKDLEFEIMPQCPATATGGSGMYIDYDANDGVVTNKSDFFAMSGSTVQQIWQSVHLKAKTDKKEYFVRNGPVADSKLLYDQFSLNYFVESDTTSNSVLIFVKYEIEFIKPQVNMNATPSGGAHAYWTTNSTSTSPNTVPNYISGLQPGTVAGSVTVGKTGLYRIKAFKDGTSGSSIISVFQVPVSSESQNTSEATVLAQLTAGTNYVAMVVSTGQLLGDSGYGVELLLVA